MYGLVAALGVSAVAALLLEHAAMLRIVGGLLMACLGIAALRRARVMQAPPPSGSVAPQPPAGQALRLAARVPAAVSARGLFGAFGTTFALTASSPMTILSFAGLLAALAPPDGSVSGGLILVAGVFAGSIAWWALLVGGVAASRKAVSPRLLRVIEAVSGVALLAFAAWSLFTGMAMA
jgi:putative LysE/RhtB family amino acid efflux pump